ncbi:hypothetical protein V1477_014999 [Vespula maculifrons]|uniref:Uncharacterized protein n=5 Tax=Vespula TaxID=7451 RepID=A0A834JNK6_VESGE|nr:hypothetical protein HZH66_010128 [Vespula vulgaris]KAF7391913.1 hypothetical protein HZH68_011456 [Vespula germanica]KAF7415558.1 hypothetical protein H0235_012150 [Vespula pensylvanica]
MHATPRLTLEKENEEKKGGGSGGEVTRVGCWCPSGRGSAGEAENKDQPLQLNANRSRETDVEGKLHGPDESPVDENQTIRRSETA